MGPATRQRLRDIIAGKRLSLAEIGTDLEILGKLFPKVDDFWALQSDGVLISHRLHYISDLLPSFISDLYRTSGYGLFCLKDDVPVLCEPESQLPGSTEGRVQKTTTGKWMDYNWIDQVLCIQWQLVWVLINKW